MWQYKIVLVDMPRANYDAWEPTTEELLLLAELGKEGWELVSATQMTSGQGYSRRVRLYFKRHTA